MKVIVKCGNNERIFVNKSTIVVGNTSDADFIIPQLPTAEFLKLIYAEKYNNYVLINSTRSHDVLCNNKNFAKVLVPAGFIVNAGIFPIPLEFKIEDDGQAVVNSTPVQPVSKTVDSVSDIEKQRIAIIKEIGYKVSDLKHYIKSAGITGSFLNVAMGILSLASSFGITNYLLGLKAEASASVLNLTTNFWFLGGTSVVVLAICLILRQSIASLLDFNARTKRRFGETALFQQFVISVTSVFLFVIYIMNLLYYKDVQGGFASVFISLLFVGALVTVTVGSGYFKHQLKSYQKELTDCEFREDFETVMKDYRKMILKDINSLSENKINTVNSNLVNKRLQMVLEFSVGMLTAPFLAYGVSNTLAGCFPEAANWVRISGLRFSPIFLVLATFLIIFAFLSFVRAFTVKKQIKGSEIIKFDGYHDYNTHGVSVLGLDSMRTLEKEGKLVMFIACFIILIEFTMNVSYFITEIGGDIQGMFLSFVTALVPTALLIAETHLLSETMFKINNYEELLAARD